MTKPSWVRTVYLYLFSLVGLALLIVGGVGFINLGLKAYVFTKADMEQKYSYGMPPSYAPLPEEKINQIKNDETKVEITAVERQAIKTWSADYDNWKKQQQEVDYVASSRQRSAAMNLALIIVGLPLFLIHWSIIRKENGKEVA